jgi:hypothetical protein
VDDSRKRRRGRAIEKVVAGTQPRVFIGKGRDRGYFIPRLQFYREI